MTIVAKQLTTLSQTKTNTTHHPSFEQENFAFSFFFRMKYYFTITPKTN